MKRIIPLLLLWLCLGILPAGAQCPNSTADINTLPVCGFYGDASGNSNWNWELTDKFDPAYCSMWYARTDNSGNLTFMKSPFVDANLLALDIISQNQDFTRAKGWELLRRDFGCSQTTAYPHFILYNKYSGLLRPFIYVPAFQGDFSGIAVEVKPSLTSAFPATTAYSDTVQTAPDKYLTGPGNFGKGMVSIGQLSGQTGWSLVEINPTFDPNIQNALYTGQGLEFLVYGVTNNLMYASIKGGSVTNSTPIYNYTYRPTQPKTQNTNGTFDFKGVGERFTQFTTTFTSIRTDLNTVSTNMVNLMGNPPYTGDSSLAKIVKSFFQKLKNTTASDSAFERALRFLSTVGTVFKVFSTVVGLFIGPPGSGAPPGGPSYTTYDLTLQGTITTRVIITSRVLRIPGTLQNNNSNAPYYNCPLGIFNIKNTPQADVVTYSRTTTFFGFGPVPVPTSWVSYKLKNNLISTFNQGAGLALVNVQAAIVGEVLPNGSGNASYDLFAPHVPDGPLSGYTLNHMRPEFESGRLEIKQFDPIKKLHVFQTPYVDIGCLNGLTFNAPATTRIYLQIKAVLKIANDPTEKPIVYMQNYEIEKTAVALEQQWVDDYIDHPQMMLTPYTNINELLTYISNRIVMNTTYTSPTSNGLITVKGDHTVATVNNVIVNAPTSTQFQLLFTAGGEVSLNPGFEAKNGSNFEARINNFGFALSCSTAVVEPYVHPVDCFNTAITALRTKPTTPAEELEPVEIKAYPVPAANKVFISGITGAKNATATLVDQSGRTVKQINLNSTSGIVSVDIAGLSNGIYYVKFQTPGGVTTKKIVVGK